MANSSTPPPILVFDIETVPDIATGRRLHPSLADLSDTDAEQAMVALRLQESDSQFMRLPLHKIACLSFLWIDPNKGGLEKFSLKSLSLQDKSEADILSTFFRAFDKQPNLVSWNGSGFDLPVILYRAMHHKLTAPALLDETGNGRKYNNYLNRYHERHLDLMDKLTLFTGFTRQPLDLVATLCGYAGKQDGEGAKMDGSQVADLVRAGDWQTLTTYCEGDVLNTWLVYLRWQRLTGAMSPETCDAFESDTLSYLKTIQNSDGQPRHQAFL